MEIRDRVAIVTGSARGIGRATALELAKAGARGVVLADVEVEELEQTRAAVEAAGAEALSIETDVSSLASLRALFDATEARFGRLDILHNNAGIGEGMGDWPAVSAERVAAICAVNLAGVTLGTKLALEPMQRSGGGVVVNTASGAAFIPLPPQAVYAATKAGVVHFTKSCTQLAQTHGVRVNCVCPGVVDTSMLRDTANGEIAPWLQAVIDGVTMLEPIDIANAVLELVRDDSKIGEVVSVENAPRQA